MAAKLSEVTVIVSLDKQHVDEFKWCYPTWKRYRPQMELMPMVIVCDTLIVSEDEWYEILEPILQRPFVVSSWDNDDMYHPEADQRENMLTALVAASTYSVNTDWYMKIDADTYCREYSDEWFDSDWFDKKYSYIAPRWGYTKPAQMLYSCEEWAMEQPYLWGLPEVVPLDSYPENRLRSTVKHRRMASWVGFGNTEFTRLAWGLVVSSGSRRMPCPSQDTFLSFMAEKLAWPIKQHNMKKYGWAHGWKHAKRMINNNFDEFSEFLPRV